VNRKQGSASGASAARWAVAVIGAMLVIVLLVGANFQLWRVGDRIDSARESSPPQQIPQLPASSGSGSRALLRELGRSQRELLGTLAGLRSDIDQALTGVQAPAGLSGQLGELTAQSKVLTPSVRSLAALGSELNRTSLSLPPIGQLTDGVSTLNQQLVDVESQLRRLSMRLGEMSDTIEKFICNENAELCRPPTTVEPSSGG